MSTVTHRARRGYRTLRLPLSEADYERFMNEGAFAKAQLDELYERHPELFPAEFNQGYALYGFSEPSRKQQLQCRRIRLTAGGMVFTVAPAFVMPYLSATVAEVDKALFLMRFHVPFFAFTGSVANIT